MLPVRRNNWAGYVPDPQHWARNCRDSYAQDGVRTFQESYKMVHDQVCEGASPSRAHVSLHHVEWWEWGWIRAEGHGRDGVCPSRGWQTRITGHTARRWDGLTAAWTSKSNKVCTESPHLPLIIACAVWSKLLILSVINQTHDSYLQIYCVWSVQLSA